MEFETFTYWLLWSGKTYPFYGFSRFFAVLKRIATYNYLKPVLDLQFDSLNHSFSAHGKKTGGNSNLKLELQLELDILNHTSVKCKIHINSFSDCPRNRLWQSEFDHQSWFALGHRDLPSQSWSSRKVWLIWTGYIICCRGGRNEKTGGN